LEQLDDRQKYRVGEVQRYWQCEMKHIESYSKTLWYNMGIHHNIPNNSNIKAYKDSDTAAILKMHAPGVYIAKQFGGSTVSVACGEYEVAYDGFRFVPLKLVYKKNYLTDCDYYYTADCVAPYLLVYDALRLFQADRKLSNQWIFQHFALIKLKFVWLKEFQVQEKLMKLCILYVVIK
jgi:hypothetical protein